MYSPRWLWDRAKENQMMLEAPFHLASPGWPVLSLGDACEQGGGDIQTGPFGSQLHASDYVEHGIPSIMPKNIGDNRVSTEAIAYISEEDAERLSRYLVRPGDIVYSRRGDVEKRALIRDSEAGWLCGTGCLRVRPGDGNLDPVYLSYYLAHPVVRSWIVRHAIGATMPNLNTSILSSLPVVMPSKREQRRIAHILGTLDDKIELNRQMNRTLEAIARAIFKSWFIDFDPVHAKAEGREPVGMDPETAALFPDSFQDSPLGKIPKGWDVGCLEGLIAFALGGDWGKAEPDGTFTEPVYCIRGTDLPALQQGDLAELRLRYLKPSSLRKRALQPGDLVFEVSGGSPTQSTGRSLIVNEALPSSYEYPLVCTNFCRLVRFNSSEIGLFIAMLLDRLYSLGEFFQHETGTTTIKNFAFAKFVQNHQIVLPDERVMSAFSRLVKSLLGARDQNGVESSSLSFTRDTLLPRLLSGEIEVPAEEGEPE